MGSGQGTKTVLRSAHVVEQHLFSLFPSTLIFDFGSVLESLFVYFLALTVNFWVERGFRHCFGVSSYKCTILTFWALMGYLWGRYMAQKLLGSPCIDEQLNLTQPSFGYFVVLVVVVVLDVIVVWL